MRIVPFFLLPVILLLGACSTPASRVARHQATFDTWPQEVREKVRVGQIAIGFTAEQVRVALGEPDRVLVRTTATGQSEVWAYRELGPEVTFGVMAGSNAPVGGEIGLGLEGYDYNETLRVSFVQDKVAAIETRRR